MTAQKRNILYWTFKVASIVVSCALPIIAILEKFPLWSSSGKKVGAGLVMIVIVVLIVFRKTVFDFAKKHLRLQHAPPIAIWLVLIATSYAMIYVADALKDMNSVLWMGLVGCAVGTAMTFIAENCFRKKVGDE